MMRNVRQGIISSSAYLYPTQKLVTAMTVAPTSARTQLINKAIFDLIQAGIWQKLDILYVLAAHDEQAGRLNWVNPGTNTCTAVNSPTFTTDIGFTGNGTTSYLDTGFVPNSATNYVLNSGSIGAWLTTTGTIDRTDFGANNDRILLRVTGSSRFQFRVQQSAPSSNAGINTNGVGLKTAVRTGSNTINLYSNGSAAGTGTQPVSSRSNFSMYILCLNTSGTASSFSTRTNVLDFMGGALTSTEVNDFYTIMNTYLTAIGAV